MSNEKSQMPKIEQLRHAQRGEETKAMEQARSVMAILEEIHGALMELASPRDQAHQPEGYRLNEMQSALNRLASLVENIQKTLPQPSIWRYLFEGLEVIRADVWREGQQLKSWIVGTGILTMLASVALTVALSGAILKYILRSLPVVILE